MGVTLGWETGLIDIGRNQATKLRRAIHRPPTLAMPIMFNLLEPISRSIAAPAEDPGYEWAEFNLPNAQDLKLLRESLLAPASRPTVKDMRT